MRWMVTGGAGFIGSRFVNMALAEGWADELVVLDALTYAGCLQNLEASRGHAGLNVVHGDIRNIDDVNGALGDGADAIFHFAAESHVDRSISGAAAFVSTNVAGTQVVLDAARQRGVGRLVHVSTDEVYGALAIGDGARFTESTPLNPTSPYAASKAASDLLVQACVRTHGLDAVITRCSNNYGPHQHPEKFIPLFITGALSGRPLPLYGDGRNVRDWIWVDDHARGIHQAFVLGKKGRVYNLGGDCERANLEIATAICETVGVPAALIRPVGDRLAHDRRYAIDAQRARRELNFAIGPPIEQRLASLVDWYREHPSWWRAAGPPLAEGVPAAAAAFSRSRRPASAAAQSAQPSRPAAD